MHKLLLVLGALALSFPAAAQTWPHKPVRMILSLGPGSGADIGARLYADGLTKMWGQPVVIENRPGGDGVIAINATIPVSYTHLRAHETPEHLVCRLLLEKK